MKAPWVALALALAGCAPRPENLPAAQPGSLGARRAIWSESVELARQRGLEPGFLYALVKAESDFDPMAKHGDARGLLQMKPRQWRQVSARPYATDVWDWRLNLRAGADVLADYKHRLTDRGHFSYPMLWACYAYGWDFVQIRGFDLARIPPPTNPVAMRLFQGNPRPLPPP